METKRYKPKTDKLFWILFIPTMGICLAAAVIPAIFRPTTLFITLPVLLFALYFFVSPFFGYVELRESQLFIKYGFFIKKSIPYEKLRGTERGRKFYSDSMLSLKNSFDHVNVKYNSFDVTTVSVEDNDDLIRELDARRLSAMNRK